MASANKWQWSCASKYCKNYWRTPEISYHRLTKVQRASKKAIDRYVDVIGCKTKEKVKWTRAVLCSAHWSKQPAMVEVDLPDVKFTTGARQVLKQVFKQVINEFDHFFCTPVGDTIKVLWKGTTILIMIYMLSLLYGTELFKNKKCMFSINRMTLFLYL